MNLKTSICLLAGVVGVCSHVASSPAQIFSATLVEKFWVTDGEVHALAVGDDVVYLGGTFNYVGPYTGGGVVLDRTTGGINMAFPRVDGTVTAFASDGQGGWFLGGDFSAVGGFSRRHLAHIRPDWRVDAAWNVELVVTRQNPLPITALTVLNGTLYFCGDFDRAGGQQRSNLAAVDGVTGQLRDWNPAPSGQFQGLRALTTHNGLIYVGGDFTSIGGSNRLGLATLDPITGRATAWNPSVRGTVLTIAPAGHTLYIGGFFDQVGGNARGNAAAVDLNTGQPLLWNPNAISSFFTSVQSLAVNGNAVYAAGFSTNIGGLKRNGFAALDAISGQATGWNPDSDGYGTAVAVHDGVVYVGGAFRSIGGENRLYLAALDELTGAATPWNPRAGGFISTVAIDSASLLVGGGRSFGGERRQNVAALRKDTGQATAWNPALGAAIQPRVKTLLLRGGKLYAGGAFTTVNGHAISNLVALDPVTGDAAELLQPNREVRALAVHEDTLYAAGLFNRIAGVTRRGLAAVNLTSGELKPWDPNLRPPSGVTVISALAVTESNLFVGGNFVTANGVTRNYLAAIDPITAEATGWDAKIPASTFRSEVLALALSGPNLFVGGAFSFTAGNLLREQLTVFDTATAAIGSFNPYQITRGIYQVNGLLPLNGVLYVASTPGNVGFDDPSMRCLVALNADSATLAGWNPSALSEGLTMTADSEYLYVGGRLETIGGQARYGFAAFAKSAELPEIVASSVRLTPPSQFQFEVRASTGSVLTLQVSENLVDWSDLTTQTATNGTTIFIDDRVLVAKRFYRIELH